MRSIIIILLLFPLFTFCQDISNSFGLITLSEHYAEDSSMISILNEDNSIWYEFSYYYDDSDGKWDYPNQDFKPLHFHPDYFILYLECVKKSGNYWMVIVNKDSGLKKKILIDKRLDLITWSDYVLNSFSIDFNAASNPLLKEINGEQLYYDKSAEIYFQPKEISGDWLKVKLATFENEEEIYGWVKWKYKGKIIIQIHLIN